MKVDPLNIVLNKNFRIDNNIYFITGNEITLIEKIKKTLVNKYKEVGSYKINKIKYASLDNSEAGLFEDNKINIIEDLKGFEENNFENLLQDKDIYIFVIQNSPKTKLYKNFFLNRKDCQFFECYDLTKDQKVKVLNHYLGLSSIKLEENIYWSLVDKLDSRFIFLLS